MQERWLIDGHNLLHHHTALTQLYAKQPAEAIIQLKKAISIWAQTRNNSCILYTDGKVTGIADNDRWVKHFQSGIKQSADSLIQQHCQKWQKKYNLHLITDDKALYRSVKARLASHQGSKEFAPEVFPALLSQKKISHEKTLSSNPSVEGTMLKNQGSSKREVDEMKLLFHLRDMDQKDQKTF